MKYLLVVTLMVSTSVFASTGGGYGGGGYSSGKPIDQYYEAGKSIYSGRSKAYRKLKICVHDKESDEKVRIKSKYMKPFRGSDIVAFSEHLYNCKMPEQSIYEILAPNDLNLVLYYLNKRYKLALTKDVPG